MSIKFEVRQSDSPFIETVTYGQTVEDGSSLRPAECNWHLVIVKQAGVTRAIIVGPLTTAGTAAWKADAEVLWVKFKLGTCMPYLPAKDVLNLETVLPEPTHQMFRLHEQTWQLPHFDNVETFIDCLVRADLLAHDPVINDVLNGQLLNIPARTMRQRFVRATGLPHNDIYQIRRAQHAAALLRQGVSILDTMEVTGYFDQPHMTRSLKQWVGYTPGQLKRLSQPG